MANTCSIVWDGKTFTLPPELGEPRSDQLQGTDLDRVVEVAGRTCYDSLGKGRTSIDYHSHIQEVGHGSVLEHPNVTFQLDNGTVEDAGMFALLLLNRPGIWTRLTGTPDDCGIRLTMNYRSVLEWDRWPVPEMMLAAADAAGLPAEGVADFGKVLKWTARGLAPLVCHSVPEARPACLDELGGDTFIRIVPPETDDEVWCSVFAKNVSRGLTHELVRHGDFTAISQRSTRYCDEDGSDWIWHPLIHQYLEGGPEENWGFLLDAQTHCRNAYGKLVTELMKFLTDRGTDKGTARKQARGAARGVLGNALATELVFSANMSQWKRMMVLRAHDAADAEIRLFFNDAFDLLSARWPERWQGWTRQKAGDGCGFMISPPAKAA